jgi:hypothetical protein
VEHRLEAQVLQPLFDDDAECSDGLFLPLLPDEKAKEDSFLLTFPEPQEGHTGDSEVLLQIFSNSSSQDEQTNS